MKRKNLAAVLGGFLLAVFFTGTVMSETGFRSRLSATLNERNTESDVLAEIEFGKEVAARVLGRFNGVNNEELTRYVNLVGLGLARNSGRADIDFRFYILESDSINAYAAPGGYIFITSGALELMEDEAELAGVLAHEIAHVSRKHIVKALEIKGSEDSGGLAKMVGGRSETARVAFSQAVDGALSVLFEKGLEQEDEFDADEVGTLILANSGYDPEALRRFLARLSKQQAHKVEVVSRTHPPFDERYKRLTEVLVSNNMQNLGYAKLEKRFRQYVKP